MSVYFPESLSLASILAEQCVHHQERLWTRMIGQRPPGCESWTIKKAECLRIDAFELWCWRRLLRVPWTARRSNQSILKEISPEYSLEGLMLKWNSKSLATWWEELTHWKRSWCWERLKAGGEGRGRDVWMIPPTPWTRVWVNSRCWWWTGRPGVLQSMGSQRIGHNWATELTIPGNLCPSPK